MNAHFKTFLGVIFADIWLIGIFVKNSHAEMLEMLLHNLITIWRTSKWYQYASFLLGMYQIDDSRFFITYFKKLYFWNHVKFLQEDKYLRWNDGLRHMLSRYHTAIASLNNAEVTRLFDLKSILPCGRCRKKSVTSLGCRITVQLICQSGNFSSISEWKSYTELCFKLWFSSGIWPRQLVWSYFDQLFGCGGFCCVLFMRSW